MDPEGSARNSYSSWPLYARSADQRAWVIGYLISIDRGSARNSCNS